MKLTLRGKSPRYRLRVAAALSMALLILGGIFGPPVLAEQPLPLVQLYAGNLGPRKIEDLTEKSISRDYALAWQNLSQAVEQNRADLLDAYFTGLAKDDFAQLIGDQKSSGAHIRYLDHGHKLEALFYSPAGDAMQLQDQAQLEIQYLDGDKVIQSEQVTYHYIVLMTPGADRWMVRDLENAPQSKP